MNGLSPVTLTCISAAFVFGMVLALLGSLKLALAKRLDLSEARISVLLSVLNFAFIPMMLISGVLIDSQGVRPILVISALVTAAAIASLGFRPTFTGAVGAVFLAGFGAAGVSTASIVLMPQSFYPEDVPASILLGTVFFALGALVTPVLTDLLLQTMEFRRTVLLLALLCLVPAGLALVTEYEQLYPPGQPPADLTQLLSSPALWMAGLVFFFYAPLEGAVSIWTTTYLTDMGHGPHRVAWALTSFWAAFLLSRLGVAHLHAQYHWAPVADKWVLVVCPLVAAIVLGNLSGTVGRYSAWVYLVLVGFILGPIFPTLVGLVATRFRPELGTAYGVMFAIGSIGSMLLAPVVGVQARRTNVAQALRVPMVIALVLAATALVFGLTFPEPPAPPA